MPLWNPTPSRTLPWETRPSPLEPLRGELFSLEHLRSHAVTIAQSMTVTQYRKSDRRFQRRFQDVARELRTSHSVISQAIRDGAPLTPEAEWLLDNFHIVEEHLHEIQDDLPPGYLRELPRQLDGTPRIFRLAVELIIHTDSMVQQDDLTAFVNEFQSVAPLSIGELWALPIMLRIALVENLRCLAGQMVVGLSSRAEMKQLLRNWKIGSPLPDVLQRESVSPDLVANTFAVLREPCLDDPACSLAIEQLLMDRFPDVTEFIRRDHRRQAANQVSIGNVITSMRLISALDWASFFETTSLAEQTLRQDPTGIYPLQDPESRDRYRHAVEQLAKRSDKTDLEVARIALTHAQSAPPEAPLQRHIGYWLIDDGRLQLEQELSYRRPFPQRIQRTMRAIPELTYFGIIAGIVGLGILVGIMWGINTALPWWVILLLNLAAVIPLSELAVSVANLFVTRFLPPHILPKLELKEGVPHHWRTFVVVPAMLTGKKEITSLLERLEMHYVSNPDPELRFALLTDFPDATAEHMDADAANVEQAIVGIRKLNETYGTPSRQPFYLFHRSRKWNAAEGVWMGWERKRGKLIEFNQLLHGDQQTTYGVQEGDLTVLNGTPESPAFPFVITLDADTQLPLGTARRMIGTLAHPLNRPQLHSSGHYVQHGYSILQPRVSVKLADSSKSWFTRLFANGKGIDPYASAASDVYQDLFGEGSFTGKGIYDVRAFEETLTDAFGENQILSHDLIEGCHVRVALVSDIEVIDGYPVRYDADMRRNHRWVRGDWQILPWLFSRVPTATGWRENRLSMLSRWKIFDNLRRSLVAPSLCALLLICWFLAPSFSAMWGLLGWLVLAFPLVSPLWNLLALPQWRYWKAHYFSAAKDIWGSLLQTAVQVACLPYKAWNMLDAVARTLVRMTVTRRRMLEWETAAATEHRLAKGRSILQKMSFVSVGTVIVAIFLPYAAWPAAAPWLLAWFATPLIAHVISQPIIRKQEELAADDKQWLRQMARETWSFFETFVNERTWWLPPDNLQEYPELKLAERISPTNEGLYLVSGLVARDFGFLSLHHLIGLWEKNLATWSQLPKLNGHFYNWYETSTLQPLMPRYISTVDSGNLAASLLVVHQGVDDICLAPAFGEPVWQGVQDTIAVAIRACDSLQPRGARIVSPPLDNLTEALRRLDQAVQMPKTWRQQQSNRQLLTSSRQELTDKLAALKASKRHPTDEVEIKVQSLLYLLAGLEEDFSRLVPWLDLYLQTDSETSPATGKTTTSSPHPRTLHEILESPLSLDQLIALPARIAEAHSVAPLAAELLAAVEAGAHAARDLKKRYETLGNQAEQMAFGMQFNFLFNPQRRLFAIGFNLEEGRLDSSHYDMLCSEARLSSHLAIAKGDVSYKHWFQLGRQMTFTAGEQGLLSWGGTMFEFLMPLLFQRAYPESLLANACEAAVARQQEYGRQQNLPWGVSESAYAALAINSDYQYQSFGVPGLGLKRGLSIDLVVAPYATMLALSISPQAAVKNLRRLAAEHALGRFGFYDAIDYTPSRVPATRKALTVRCYMAHHQAMSLTAIANVLLDQVIEKRFHRHPQIRATEMLLQEVMPVQAPTIQPHADETAVEIKTTREQSVIVSRRMIGHESPVPRSHLLSNGTYSVMMTNGGAGYSLWGSTGVNRWRPDATQESGGQYIYLRDRKSGQVWSATYLPTCQKPDAYEVIYAIDKAEYRRRDGTLETHLEVAVSPDSQVEVRELTITNHGWQPRELEITSYLEVTLASPAADQAHPAFQKLFVETEYIPEETALIARRRPRESHADPLYGVHVLSCPDLSNNSVEYESSREKFLGRGHDPRRPAALDPNVRLTGTTGLVLDPVFSLRCRVTVASYSSVTLAFSTGVAQTREEALQLADQFHEPRSVQRAFEMAWVFNQVQLHHLQITAAQAQRFQQLAGMLLFPMRQNRGTETSLKSNRQGQSGLWRFGISGDRRILLVTIAEAEHADFVREMMLAHEYWRHHGLSIDLVILNTHPGSYLDLLQEKLQRFVQETPRIVTETKETIFLLRAAQLTQEDLWLLETVAQVVIDARRGWTSLTSPTVTKAPEIAPVVKKATQPMLARLGIPTGPLTPRNSTPQPTQSPSSSAHTKELEYWNGMGGFFNQGREYHILLQPEKRTPTPWSNIIANPRFGTLVTEGGSGFTWAGNSRQNKLTTWSNDPVTDPPAEILYLCDEQTQAIWQPTAYPEQPSAKTWVHHGQGYTRFHRSQIDLEQEVLISIAPEDPVKFICLRMQNRGSTPRQIAATYYAELVLGVLREQTQMHLISEWNTELGALLIRNPYHSTARDQMAFQKVLGPNCSWTADRYEFLGRNQSAQSPAALRGEGLSRQTGAGLDPCAVVQSRFTLAPGQEIQIIFLLGCGASAVEAHDLLRRYSTVESIRSACDATIARWDELLTAVQIKTPNRAFDLLVNRWLLYQVSSCRLWGRSAFYQCGGAYGFRDQLQDVMALVYSRPDYAREHILRAAARQFEAGDVQHWWHPPQGEGTRTRFSDDLLWLPFVVAHYVRVTGDEQILDEVVPYLSSHPLDVGELERYELPQVSSLQGTLYEHSLKTLERGFRLGEHGLPLMGCGDWNDGMSQVGALGRGESVWVGWFLLVLLEEFLPLCERRNDHSTVDHWQQRARELRSSLEQNAWDGGWYRRAYFDDGTPLGSHQNDECQIDSIVQSWAILANADPERTDQALEAVFDRLVSHEHRFVVLFAPPFDKTNLDPGYIKGYLPGVRENGGQYTHAVLWLIQALTQKGDGERAMQLFDYINPLLHASRPEEVQIYRAEPYVIAADVYSMPPHTGRAGWSWYTGSASWTYRIALESILGLRLTPGKIQFRPQVPADWDQFEVTLRIGKTRHHFVVQVPESTADEVTTEGAGAESPVLDLVDDGGEHRHSFPVKWTPLFGPGG